MPAGVAVRAHFFPQSLLLSEWMHSFHWCPLCMCVLSCMHCLCCVYLIPRSRGLQGNSWSRGSSGLSAWGSRCSSPFHCSPYGPAAQGPRGPVSAAPPRPAPCHQAPLASCLTPAITLSFPLLRLPLRFPSFLFVWLSGSCLSVNPHLPRLFYCLTLAILAVFLFFSFSLCILIDVSFLRCLICLLFLLAMPSSAMQRG